MDEKAPATRRSKLTKRQAYTLVAIGGLMLLLSAVIPTEPDSTVHTIKVIVGALGICIALAGAGLRPIEPPKTPKG